jgi:phosphoglycolate phosphatase-like HAD superfamily hydrolase
VASKLVQQDRPADQLAALAAKLYSFSLDYDQREEAVPIKTIVFDASGTLLNDIYAVWKANSDAYAALGLGSPGTLEEFKMRFKLPTAEFHRANGIPPDLLKEVEKKSRECYLKYAPCVGIFPEVDDVLQELKKRGAILGVASNIPTLFLREHLKKFKIEGYFDTIIGQEDCDEQKPSPKPILITIEKLGARPQEAMYVGDMEEDIIAGKMAKAVTVAIVRNESYHPRWRLERQKPDFLISSLRELLLGCSG